MKKQNNLIIAIDFDGSLCKHEYPYVGDDIGAVPVLKRIIAAGHRLMLWTMRGNKPLVNGIDTLAEAVNWFKNNDIPLWGINENPDQKASGWTNSNKQHADLFIDDAALGAYLKQDYMHMGNGTDIEQPSLVTNGRPYLDWDKIETKLENMGIIPTKF